LELLQISALFSLSSVFPLPRASFRVGASRNCLLLTGFADCDRGGLSGGFPSALLLNGVFLPGRVRLAAATVWRLFEVKAKAWMMTSTDVVRFLETSFPTSPPTVLDVASENLLLTGYLVNPLSVVSSLDVLLGLPVLRLLLVVWPWWCLKLCCLVSSVWTSFSSVLMSC
jgi:hypothetical protein